MLDRNARFAAATAPNQLDLQNLAGPVGPFPIGAGNAREFFSVTVLNFVDRWLTFIT